MRFRMSSSRVIGRVGGVVSLLMALICVQALGQTPIGSYEGRVEDSNQVLRLDVRLYWEPPQVEGAHEVTSGTIATYTVVLPGPYPEFEYSVTESASDVASTRPLWKAMESTPYSVLVAVEPIGLFVRKIHAVHRIGDRLLVLEQGIKSISLRTVELANGEDHVVDLWPMGWHSVLEGAHFEQTESGVCFFFEEYSSEQKFRRSHYFALHRDSPSPVRIEQAEAPESLRAKEGKGGSLVGMPTYATIFSELAARIRSMPHPEGERKP